jgi:shikimate kinase
MVVTLIGYRGSGKSTIAEPLAARLGWSWCDSDSEIELLAGKDIRTIFAEDGEPRFRQLERDVMARLLARDNLVIAAGGGAVLDEQTARAMRAAGPVVWLQAGVDVLAERIQGDAGTSARRPNLTDLGGRDEIEKLLALREPQYRQCASVIVKTDGLAVDEICRRVFDAIEPAVRGECRS